MCGKARNSFSYGPPARRMQLPQELLSHVAEYIADDLRAIDPSFYRAARRVQAACRGRLVRKANREKELQRTCNCQFFTYNTPCTYMQAR